MATREETFIFSSVIRGHHVYKVTWTPYISENLTANIEEDNPHDRHAIALTRGAGNIVGHMPQKIAPLCWFCNRNGGSIKSVVTGKRKKGIGLEVPCDYVCSGSQRIIKKLKRLLSQVDTES